MRTSAEMPTVAWMRSPTTTTKTYQPSWTSRPHPKRDVITKISPKTPYGASFMAMSMILMTASPMPSISSTTGSAFFLGNIVSAAPKISAKKMTPSMSMLAIAAIGLRGTMFTKVLTPNC